MKDPDPSLLNSLDALLQLQPIRNGRYPYREVQALKEARDLYAQNPSKECFYRLVKNTVRALNLRSLHHMHNKELFVQLKKALHETAQYYGLANIKWPPSTFYSSSMLQFNTKEYDLLQWLTTKYNKPYSKCSIMEQTQLLIENKTEHKFRIKLKKHLQEDADFLLHLMLHSMECFEKITSSLLILYLTDEQIATAIIAHLPKKALLLEEVDQYINKINETLSHGYSISTLLRNTHAKKILDASPIFQIYQDNDKTLKGS